MLVAAAVPARELSPVERLNAELLASPTATAVLERRCAALGLPGAPRVHAEVERGRVPAGDAPPHSRLEVATGDVLGFRRVRLMCGAVVLSEAANWYVPARLTHGMNAVLDTSDVPFGRVILPLAPQRRTLSVWVAEHGLGPDGEILRHHAIVLDDARRPLAEVIERYRPALIG